MLVISTALHYLICTCMFCGNRPVLVISFTWHYLIYIYLFNSHRSVLIIPIARCYLISAHLFWLSFLCLSDSSLRVIQRPDGLMAAAVLVCGTASESSLMVMQPGVLSSRRFLVHSVCCRLRKRIVAISASIADSFGVAAPVIRLEQGTASPKHATYGITFVCHMARCS